MHVLVKKMLIIKFSALIIDKIYQMHLGAVKQVIIITLQYTSSHICLPVSLTCLMVGFQK